MSENLLMAVPLLFIVAALYSSVGHGGASGYLAVFSLIGVTMAPLVPVVLSLNILVASISFLHFRKPGNFSFARLLPFIITSIPAAYVGGMWKLSGTAFSVVLGVALLSAGLRMFVVSPKLRSIPLEGWPLWRVALPIGLVLGLVSGMIGIGGGVFLSPIIIFLGLTDTKGSAAMSSAFIVLNSISGLVAKAPHIAIDPMIFGAFLLAGVCGALLGSNWGAFKSQARNLRFALGCVLIFASVKLLAAAL